MKKSLRRKTAVLLSLAMAATLMPTGMTSIAADTGSAAPEILFSSSFEKDETHQLLESKVDGQGADKRAANVNGKFSLGTLKGDLTDTVLLESIKGSTDFNSNESKIRLFDYNTGSKFLNQHATISESNPVWVSFALKDEAVVRTYLIASANDEPSRDPKNWTLYGSADNETWKALDQQTNQTFGDRKVEKVYTFSNDTAYKYYKLAITANNGQGMTQLSELQLGSGEEEAALNSPMQTVSSGGPTSVWVGTAGTGWTGDKALKICGTHAGSDHGYSYNVLYENLSIPVAKNTELSYVFLPAALSEYDYDYTSMHMAVDLKFSDGTYLSELAPTDQYGNPLTPEAQADCKFMYTMQWNAIRSRIGSVAAGKTIEKILIGYDNTDPAAADTSFLAYLDDVVIQNKEAAQYENLTDYVDIRRGSNSGGGSNFSRGLIQPLVTTPHGFNHYEPCTGDGNGNMQYRYQQGGSNTTLKHISVNHFASNWIGEYGTWQFMANTSIDADTVTKGEDINASARAADFSHDNEIANAHLYSVKFDEGSKASGVTMSVTPTEHAAFTRFVFPEGAENRNVILDCERADGGLTFGDDGSFTAYSDHTNNGSKRMYVYGVFMNEAEGSPAVVNKKQGIVSFPAAAGGDTVVTMKFATSFISADQAKKNLELEISDRDTFDTVLAAAQKTWEDKLHIIEIEGATEDQMITFYSNMYRMFSYPMNFSENTGTNEAPVWQYSSPYSGSNDKPVVKDGKIFAINGFWDTYRTTWAAYALLTPTKDAEMLNGLVQHYNDVGWVPRWIAPGGTNSMVGTNSDVIFGDAAQRGIEFDWEGALQSSIRNASVYSTSETLGRKQTDTSVFRGYTSTSQGEGFSWSMESYINDYGISQLAAALTAKGTDYSNEVEYYRNRAQNYVNLYNADLGWFMGRNDDGSFRVTNASNYNPQSWWGDYTETNGYNMAYSVPQDGQGLANLYGGREELGKKLDGLFNTQCQDTRTGTDTIHEEMEAREVKMGLYGHSNQPSHHIPYMYNYAGQPWKTQEKVREVMDRLYVGSEIGQGYCGDEDNGEMSAWYVLSALGIYPVSMGNPEFAIGSPLFDKATIHLDGKTDAAHTFTITANNNSRENVYVQSVKLNGKAYDKTSIQHADLAAGGTLEFEMGSAPSTWGTGEDALPTSITEGDAMPAPAKDVVAKNPLTATRPNYNSTSDLIASRDFSAADQRTLFDNTSATSVTVSSDQASVYFTSPDAPKVSMVTVTSGSNPANAPTAVALYGSNDGKTWEKLMEQETAFTWAQYTRPFLVDSAKVAAYTTYRLDLSTTGSAMQISELEFIAGQEVKVDRTKLDEALKKAASLDKTIYTPETWEKLEAAVAAANNLSPDATQLQVDAAKKAVLDAIDALELVLIKGDVNKDGSINISDVMSACKILARQSIGQLPTQDEIDRADLNGDTHVTITDVMVLCKILASRTQTEK